MSGYDTVIMVDWSGGTDRGPTPKADAIWVARLGPDGRDAPCYMRNRQVAEAWLVEALGAERAAGRRVLVGFDFAFGFPAGVARTVTGRDDTFALWDWIAERVTDTPAANNRFDVAAEMNGCFAGEGPFWGNGLKRDIPGLPRKGRARTAQVPERRAAEAAARGAFPVWQLSGAGAVGGQVLMGLPVLARLRARFGADLSIWPFEADAPIRVVEVWPSLVLKGPSPAGQVKDAWQVETLAARIAALAPDKLAELLDGPMPEAARREEGWILGLGQEDALTRLRPPPLRNDCFALPPGHHWTPVDEALAMLRARLRCVVPAEHVPLGDALGRVLASDVIAVRAHPPAPNAAVDGYGFAHGTLPAGPQEIPLTPGRAAAGVPHTQPVPPGTALRVLTGAILPEGVDTLILEEDVTATSTSIALRDLPRRGANTRAAGEDSQAGQRVLKSGQRLRPQDVALAASVGVGALETYRSLRVAVLSTGSELATPGQAAGPAQVFDANRPMLLGLVRQWGAEAVDLGPVPDDRDRLGAVLDRAASEADMILTSGGASAGDEDHVSALLTEAGAMSLWRIALKPGRPLAMGVWNGAPVFGLPGNPVAAFVCALLFAWPAMGVLGGSGWHAPQRWQVPAAFTKRKKPGRSEYLRARLNPEGHAEVFPSEGSGRVSGLAWAEGLVELGEDAQEIVPGTPVTYLPFSGFGL